MKRIGVADIARLAMSLDEARFASDAVLLGQVPAYLKFIDGDRQFLQTMGYAVSAANIDLFEGALSAEPLNPQFIRQAAENLITNLLHELKASYFLALSTEEATRFTRQKPFGDDVAEALPSASYDIAEATNCLALGRSTACVYHLARVVEAAVRRIAGELNFDVPINPTWEMVIAPLRAELNKAPKDRSSAWNADPAFFAGATERVMAIRDAWRNQAVHIEGKYTEREAEDIWNSVGAFMRLLATKLRDQP